jgi:hypothetical protein
MSRGVYVGAFLLAVVIIVGLYLFGVSSSPPEVVRTSGGPAETAPTEPAPAAPSGPVDTNEDGGAQNTNGAEPPPQ